MAWDRSLLNPSLSSQGIVKDRFRPGNSAGRPKTRKIRNRPKGLTQAARLPVPTHSKGPDPRTTGPVARPDLTNPHSLWSKYSTGAATLPKGKVAWGCETPRSASVPRARACLGQIEFTLPPRTRLPKPWLPRGQGDRLSPIKRGTLDKNWSGRAASTTRQAR